MRAFPSRITARRRKCYSVVSDKIIGDDVCWSRAVGRYRSVQPVPVIVAATRNHVQYILVPQTGDYSLRHPIYHPKSTDSDMQTASKLLNYTEVRLAILTWSSSEVTDFCRGSRTRTLLGTILSVYGYGMSTSALPFFSSLSLSTTSSICEGRMRVSG